ncbi:MAG TPA: glycosyltransferase family 9 protein [Candidatus Binataceae bacterium]
MKGKDGKYDVISNSEDSRILVIFPGALGDLICLGPTLDAIFGRHPGHHLELMARSELAKFACGRMRTARAHSIDRLEMSALFRHDGKIGAARQFFSRFARIYSFFASDDSRYRRALTEASNGHASFHPFRPPADGHVAMAYLRSIDAADAVGRYRLDLLDDDLRDASSILGDHGLTAGRFLLILPGSGSSPKNWPAHKFAALARGISGRMRVLIVIGPAEESLENEFAPRDFLTLKSPPLGTLAAIARMSSAFVGNDSGVSHLAAAAGARGVVLFGPTDSSRWRPLGDVQTIHEQPIETIAVIEVGSTLHRLLETQSLP